MKKVSLFLMIIGVLFLLPACSDDDNDVTDGYTIVAEPNDPEYGSVSGAGVYNEGKTVTLTATPEEGYVFSFWTEDGEIVHDESIYEFTATENRILVAFFSEEDEDVAGYFSAEVTGDVEWSFEGFAFFGETTHEETGQDMFVVFLTDMQGEASFAFAKGGDRPGSGEMNIGDFDVDDIEYEFVFPDDVFLAILNYVSGAQFYVFASDGGSINITESSAEAFIADFSYSATGVLATQPGNELEINVEGGFNAIPGDVDIPGL